MTEKPQWTTGLEDTLILMWSEGNTCQQISDFFKSEGFNFSRNAVSAKARRMREKCFEIAKRGSPIFTKKKESLLCLKK